MKEKVVLAGKNWGEMWGHSGLHAKRREKKQKRKSRKEGKHQETNSEKRTGGHASNPPKEGEKTRQPGCRFPPRKWGPREKEVGRWVPATRGGKHKGIRRISPGGGGKRCKKNLFMEGEKEKTIESKEASVKKR